MNKNALKARLQIVAKEKEIPFNACWKQLILERFLARLAASSFEDSLIFKGGFLLSYLIDIGRETVDLDFLLTRISVEKDKLHAIISEILQIQSPFQPRSAQKD